MLPRIALSLLFCLAATARAQCPDGSPPPCKGGMPVALRRVNPPLDARAWIVVPFANITKSPDLDWLRDASVNLLSLDLGRWTDIKVVDDKRVGDLVREMPSAKSAGALTLNDGLALARRAGAGTLVMGDFYRLGKGARLVANVFDVRNGSRIRSITQQALDQDSLLTAFGPLARGVLAVQPPPDAKVGVTGTTKLDAYQEYLLGSVALNRFELAAAMEHLRKALAIDSTFALAHYKLSIAVGWADDPDGVAERAHAASAARLGSSLPPRERALITGRMVAANNDPASACSALRALVAKDSNDVEVVYAMADCEYHGMFGAPEVIDSVTAHFRGNLNTAIALFQRVLRLDPTYHPAFAHVLDALSRPQIVWCPTRTTACANDATAWTGIIIRDGDSLLVEPAPSGAVKQRARAEANRSQYLNMRAARAIAREWVYAGAGEARAQLELGELDMLLGDVAAAELALTEIGAKSDAYARRSALDDRMIIAIIRGNGSRARALFDTLKREMPDGRALRQLVGMAPAAFGDLKSAAMAIDEFTTAQRWPRERIELTRRSPLVMLGLPAPGVDDIERRYWETLTTDSVCAAGSPRCRTTALLATQAYASRAPRKWWPPYATPELGFRFGPSRALALRDTALLREAANELDAIAATRLRSVGDDQATSVIAVDAALALGDTVMAMRLTRQFVDSVMPGITRLTTSLGYVTGWSVLLAPRMMLQRADLAAALGNVDEARTWYTKVLDLWSDADPELQPTVARIRGALAGIGAKR
jgi:tetratricopeptide (TPR) repeat protein/TolB-like protein